MDIPDIDRAQLSHSRLNFTRQKDKLQQHVRAEHCQVNGPCPACTPIGGIFSMKTIIEWTGQGPPLRADVFPSCFGPKRKDGDLEDDWRNGLP